ncbi:hypothetical protein ACP70R_048150 [Stipagrostis hirtigluma subsp. patula]
MAAMASRRPCVAASDSGDLPLDELSEILLRLPAKELCRLRVVSPSWRSLTLDPAFIAAHRARHHTEPLLALAYHGDDKAHIVDIVDTCGELVRRIPRGELVRAGPTGEVDGIYMLRTHFDLVCVACRYQSRALWVLNPATGAVLTLPECRSVGLKARLWSLRRTTGPGPAVVPGLWPVESYAFGRVSTGEYKALRITGRGPFRNKFCEVITIDSHGSNHGPWRLTHDAPARICTGGWKLSHKIADETKCVVVHGVVHYLIDFRKSLYDDSWETTVEPGSIASFNLEIEQWMTILPGPAPLRSFLLDNIGDYSCRDLYMQLSLSHLQGCLVTVHNNHNISLDLWFLTDFENGLWVKKYSMPSQATGLFVYPLLVSGDERILFRHGLGLIRSYDLKAGIYTDVLQLETGLSDSTSIGIYTGSLLSS